MNDQAKILIFGTLGVAALGGLWYIMNSQSAPAVATSPATAGTWSTGSSPQVPGLNVPAALQNAAQNFTAVFNITPPAAVAPISITSPQPGGSPDGSTTGPCNCPAQGSQNYGGSNDAATAAIGVMGNLLDQMLSSVQPAQYSLEQRYYGGNTPLGTALAMIRAGAVQAPWSKWKAPPNPLSLPNWGVYDALGPY